MVAQAGTQAMNVDEGVGPSDPIHCCLFAFPIEKVRSENDACPCLAS